MIQIKIICAVIITFIVLANEINSLSNILGLFSFPGKSHFMVFKAIMMELAKRGHNVTVVSNFRIDEKIPNYAEIVIEPMEDYWAEVTLKLDKSDSFDMENLSSLDVLEIINIISLRTEKFLENSNVRQIVNDYNNTKYDLIIVEEFYQDALLAFGEIYKAPVVAITTSCFENHMSSMLGLILPWAHYSQNFLAYSDSMTFWQRFHNIYSSLKYEYNRRYHYYPQQDRLVKKYITNSSDFRTVEEIRRDISLLFVNSYAPFDYLRPTTDLVIHIGGVHITPPKTLQWDVKRFLDDARKGAIYFSMGTNIKCSELSKEKLQIFVEVFSKLTEHVLWQCDNEKLIPKLPENIKLKKWVSQSDVLAHPHVKYFITHGGMLSLQEAVYRNKPILGIPVFGDQHINIEKIEDLGIGVKINFEDLTVASLTWALQKILYDSSYSINMRKISKIFRDRPVGAMETTIYWIEYVMRFQGTSYLKMVSRSSPWYEVYLIDIVSFIFFVILLSFCGLFALIKMYQIIKNNNKKRIQKLGSKDF